MTPSPNHSVRYFPFGIPLILTFTVLVFVVGEGADVDVFVVGG